MRVEIFHDSMKKLIKKFCISIAMNSLLYAALQCC